MTEDEEMRELKRRGLMLCDLAEYIARGKRLPEPGGESGEESGTGTSIGQEKPDESGKKIP